MCYLPIDTISFFLVMLNRRSGTLPEWAFNYANWRLYLLPVAEHEGLILFSHYLSIHRPNRHVHSIAHVLLIRHTLAGKVFIRIISPSLSHTKQVQIDSRPRESTWWWSALLHWTTFHLYYCRHLILTAKMRSRHDEFCMLSCYTISFLTLN